MKTVGKIIYISFYTFLARDSFLFVAVLYGFYDYPHEIVGKAKADRVISTVTHVKLRDINYPKVWGR